MANNYICNSCDILYDKTHRCEKAYYVQMHHRVLSNRQNIVVLITAGSWVNGFQNYVTFKLKKKLFLRLESDADIVVLINKWFKTRIFEVIL